MAIPFLTAQWRYLFMVNYEVDPAVLAPYLPAGVELDDWHGKTLASMVGFRFLNTRVLGVPVPFHTNFDEVNLRFYVRRRVGEEWRRGVVFVKEIVPRPWIARVARLLYKEPYVAMPMGHTVEADRKPRPQNGAPGGAPAHSWLVEYTWKHRPPRALRRKLHRLGGLITAPSGDPRPIEPGSIEEFITEHYWGYTRLSATTTAEYRVEHPRWRAWPVAQPYLLCDVKALYGASFEPDLRRRPHSALLAEGSAIKVFLGSKITAKKEQDPR